MGKRGERFIVASNESPRDVWISCDLKDAAGKLSVREYLAKKTSRTMN